MNKAIKIGLIATIIVYAIGVSYTYYSNQKFNQQFEHLDVDKDGVLNSDEKTKTSKVFLNALEKRKTTNEALIILIPVSLFIGVICFGITILFKKMKTIDTNEINYQ
ncbi:hypothetical protein [Lacinutrix sp. MEBiC02595]